ncbi:MAG TPA: folate-binding protein [Eoetvoesiella sp.]
MKDFVSYIAPLSDLAVIEITGADAASFLHSQLTHDVVNLEVGQARLTGYCTAKGRLLGSLIFWHVQNAENPTICALVKADIAEALVKRLSMFVLRAKAKLTITDLRVLGLSVESTASDNTSSPAIGNQSVQGPDNPPCLDLSTLPSGPQPGAVVQTPNATYVAAPSAEPAITRWWAVVASNAAPKPETPPSSGAAPLPTLSAPAPISTLEHTDYNAQWQSADIAAGLPWVVAATQDVFIPQTLNLDLIDGVSFSKGCYPGQEVVARSHYRGTVKRRMAYGIISEVPAQPAQTLPGVDIFNAHNPNSPCGRVINAAQTHQTHVLLEVQLSDLDSADFRLGQADGPPIAIHALPYPITVSS